MMMKLKLDADGHVVLSDGKPVYVADDGREIAFDAPGTVATITRLNGEAKSHRERAEAAEGKVKLFEGIDDPAAARKALETLQSLDQKKLIDAGEVEKVRSEISKGYEAKLSESAQKYQTLEQQLYAEKVGGSFARSKVVAEKLAIPADLVEARFGSAFKLEDGQIVAVDKSGNKIYSPARPGEVANFDEALEVLIGQYPYKDQILKASGASGGGASASAPNASQSKTATRAQFDAMAPAERVTFAKSKGAIVD
jgi:hypothetical protein